MLAHLDRMARDEGASALNVTADLLNEPAQQAYLAQVFKRREKMELIFKNSYQGTSILTVFAMTERFEYPETRLKTVS